jgi:hypothetical protein
LPGSDEGHGYRVREVVTAGAAIVTAALGGILVYGFSCNQGYSCPDNGCQPGAALAGCSFSALAIGAILVVAFIAIELAIASTLRRFRPRA